MSGPLVDAVTFDFWNTICVPDNDRFREQRNDATLALLLAEGMDVSAADVTSAFVGLFELFNEKWAANEQFTAVDAAGVVADRLDPDMSPDTRVRLADALSSTNGQPSLAPNIAETLATLDGAGLRIGIICDVGMASSVALRQHLERYEILHHFDHWSFSDEVGIYKPHPQIFEHALAGLGVPAERCAHIGDLRRTDVAGALDMGMLAIRYKGVFDDPGDGGDVGLLVEGDHVIDDHADLPAILGIT